MVGENLWEEDVCGVARASPSHRVIVRNLLATSSEGFRNALGLVISVGWQQNGVGKSSILRQSKLGIEDGSACDGRIEHEGS